MMPQAAMYVPTQQERYSKVARITLFLCVIIPCGVVAWLGGVDDWLGCMLAFLQPIALPLSYMGLGANAALCLSALVQGIAFFPLSRSRKLSPKAKLTVAVTWGMSSALLLRLLLAFEAWRSVMGAAG